jgi:membrane-bound lytic murein transglycosylase D
MTETVKFYKKRSKPLFSDFLTPLQDLFLKKGKIKISNKMNIPWTLVAVMVALCSYSAYSNNTTTDLYITETIDANNITTEAYYDETTTEIGIQDRLSRIDIPFRFTYTDDITKQVRQYVTTGKRDTERILGRTELFFPIFEHYLEAYDLPMELKYLPMIESGLRLDIRSHAGAVGLWQMMGITARHYKLTVDQYMDERHDPYRATEAAVRMLSDMYKMFGDWSLVLAAYNSGPGRVQQAIRTAGSKNFDVVKNYLPKETQLYIPKFVAAAYIANYYSNHDLIPRLPQYDLRNTRTLKVYQRASFSELAKASGLDYGTIAGLNPVYLKGFVPGHAKGNFIVLPENAVEKVRDYLAKKGTSIKAPIPAGKFKMTYTVEKGESIDTLAKRFKCTIEEIMVWNNLKKADIVINQQLVLYLSKAAAFNRA